MKAFLRTTIQGFTMAAAAVLLALSIISCTTQEVELQQDFPFEVTVMPVPKEIGAGETIEIRLAIHPAGNYSGTDYFIRYFQFDGKGILRCKGAPPYIPNDRYLLPGKEFRLHYTSLSAVSQSFDVWISDSFGNERVLHFQFSSSD
jgi:hypothetical protein